MRMPGPVARSAGPVARRQRKRPILLTAALLAPILLASCTIGPSTRPALATSDSFDPVRTSPSTAATMPTGPGGPGRTADPIAWADCPAQIPAGDSASGRNFKLQCAQVEVPRSYSDATSGVLSLEVTKATAPGTPAGAPPLVVALDEPGSVGTHRIAQVAGHLPAAVLAHFSVVVVDLRGTGDSAAIDCVSAQNSDNLLALGADPTTPGGEKLLTELSRSLTFDCGDLVGPGLSDYSTVLAADDLDSVRSALGVSRIDFLGRGWGGTLGAVYADRYPGRIHAAVLDGPADPSSAPDKQAAAAAVADEKAFGAFAAACPTFPGGCPLGADPAGAVKALVTTLGDSGDVSADGHLISGGTVLLTLVGQLGNPAGWPALATALAKAREQNYEPLTNLLLAEFGSQDIERNQSGRLVFHCNDAPQRLGGTALAAAARAARASSPLFGPFLVGLLGVCSSWPAPESPLGRVTGAGAPPLLVLGSVDDPVAPYDGVRALVAVLTSARLISWQSGTHGSYPASSCITAAVNSYLLAGALPAGGTLCPP